MGQSTKAKQSICSRKMESSSLVSAVKISMITTRSLFSVLSGHLLHYSIGNAVTDDKDNNTNKKTAKNAILEWAIGRTSEYPNVNKFQPYSVAMCALLVSYVPDKINFYQLKPENVEDNADLACKVMEELGITVYVMPEDLVNNNDNVDEKTLLTQLAAAKVVLENLQVKEEHVQQEANKEAQEKAEANRLTKEKAETDARAEAERLAKEKAEEERLAKEKAEAEAKAEAERFAREKAEAAARAEEERLVKESAEAESKAKAETDGLLAEIERLKKALSESETSHTKLNQEFTQFKASAKQDHDNLTAEIERLKKELSTTTAKATEDHNKLTAEIEKLKKESLSEIDHLKAQLSETQRKAQSYISISLILLKNVKCLYTLWQNLYFDIMTKYIKMIKTQIIFQIPILKSLI